MENFPEVRREDDLWRKLTRMKMQFCDKVYMDCHPTSRSHLGPMSSLRSQFMETEAFQDLMEQSFYDCSTDGGSDSGENSLGGMRGGVTSGRVGGRFPG